MGVVSSFGNEPGNPVIDRGRCTLCGECIAVCPLEVFSRGEDGIRVDRERGFGCIACAQCMMTCPADCISVTGRRLSRDSLFELPPPEARATVEQVEALLSSRRSIRRFKEEEVSREAIDRVVAAAATAPMGIPPWEVGVTVFRGRGSVRELARDTADTYEKFGRLFGGPVGVVLRLFMTRASREQLRSFILPLGGIIADGRKKRVDYALYDAPAALLFHASPYGDAADAFIACTYAMVAAEAMGLGSCMIGCVAPAIARRKDLLKKYGLPDGHMPKIVLILGHPAVRFLRAVRRPFHSVAERVGFPSDNGGSARSAP